MKVKGLQALRNIVYMYLAQLAQMLLSIMMSLYVPMAIGLTEFSYWQLFIFYSTYVGILHLGLNDGVYLKYGGKKLNETDKQSVSDQLWMSMSFQVLILLLTFAVLVLLSSSKERLIVLGMVLIYAITNNVYNYCGSVLQAINRIKLYSYSIVIDKVFVITSIIVITALGVHHFLWLIICYVSGKMIAVMILLSCNRAIFIRRFRFGGRIFREMVSNMRCGSSLMFANIVSSMIIGVGRFFIDINYPVETFGIISFAFTLTGFILALVSQVGNSVFPILKAKDASFLVKIYPRLNRLLSFLLPFSFVGYPLVAIFISCYLPQYKDSLEYFVFLLPMCIYEAKTMMLYNTYVKVIRKEQMLLVYNLMCFIFSLVITLFSVYLFHDLSLLVIGLMSSVVIKSILLHLFICQTLELSKLKNFIFSDLTISVLVVLLILMNNSLLQMTMYILFLLILFSLIKGKVIVNEIQELFIYREK